MTPQLHPSEVRVPAPEKRAGRKRLRALQIGVAAAAVAASFAAAAYVVTQLPEEPAPKVTFNRIDDWPEIKNGVPALAPPKPAPAAAVAPPLPPDTAPPAAKAEPAAPPKAPTFAAAPPEPQAVTGLELRRPPVMADEPPSPAPEPPPITVSAPVAPVADEPAKSPAPVAEAEMPAENLVAATATPVVPPTVPQAAADASPAVAAAAKPAKARVSPGAQQSGAPPKHAAKIAKAKPRTEKVASAPPTAPPAAPAPPPEDDRVHVLGLSLPNLLPSGRKIREVVESLGL
jgi:hypothetical protein